jgi:hypothetical protein
LTEPLLTDVILRLAGEVRQQLGLQLSISKALIDLRVVREFQETVIDVIREESPETARRIVARLKERRAFDPARSCPRSMMEARMALGRDPLDDLIDGLDRSVPTAAVSDCQLPDLVLMQRLTTTLLYGSDDERAHMETEPWYHEWQRQRDRFTTGRSFIHGNEKRPYLRGSVVPHALVLY